MWAAFVINHVLTTARRHDLIPITPNVVFYELLQLKLKYLDTLKVQKENEVLYFNHPEYKANFSSFSLAMCLLPDFEMSSFDDVLEIRNALKDELVAFRHEIFSLGEFIKVSTWSEEFLPQINYIKEHKIEPVINDLQNKLKNNKRRIVRDALKMSTSSGLSLVAGIWSGMPIILVMAVAAGLITLGTALQYHFEREKIYQSNSLSFLLGLQ